MPLWEPWDVFVRYTPTKLYESHFVLRTLPRTLRGTVSHHDSASLSAPPRPSLVCLYGTNVSSLGECAQWSVVGGQWSKVKVKVWVPRHAPLTRGQGPVEHACYLVGFSFSSPSVVTITITTINNSSFSQSAGQSVSRRKEAPFTGYRMPTCATVPVPCHTSQASTHTSFVAG